MARNKTFKKSTVYKGDKSKTPFLDSVKKLQEEKDVDTIEEIIWTMITMNGLRMDEVAALLYSVMVGVLNNPANKKVLEEDLKIDITQATYYDGGVITPQQKVLDVQRALLNEYIRKLQEKGGSN